MHIQKIRRRAMLGGTALLATLSIGSMRSSVASAKQAETNVYDRVVKNSKIRVGYVVQPPAVMQDPNSGKKYGVFVDILLQAAKNLGLQVEWTEEVSWGTMIEGLLSDRYDLVCTQVWPSAARAVQADFSEPLYYVGVGAFVRHGDHRFNNRLAAANAPNVKIATLDGEMSDTIGRTMFPKAQKISLPQLTDVSQMLLQVSQGKADMTFAMTYDGDRFLKANPGTLENILADNPIQIFPNTYMFRRGQFEFKSMLNAAIIELINSGFVDEINNKYEEFPGALYRHALMYRPSPLLKKL